MQVVVCGGACDSDDATAPGRHALIAALGEIGIEAEETYLGAGCTSVYVTDLDGAWSFVNGNSGELDQEWSVEYHYDGGGAGCLHTLNPTTDPPEEVARYIRDAFLRDHASHCEDA